MNLTTFDIAKICSYIITFGTGIIALLPQTNLVPPSDLSRISGVISLTVGIATLILNTLKNPSPPTGTVSANIPIGSIPAVGTPTAAGGQQVAHIDAATATVTPANVSPATLATLKNGP